MESDIRQWGGYRVILDSPTHKVKEITVNSGERLSLQYHNHRKEHWYIVSGIAKAIKGKTPRILTAGDSIDIHLGEVHRIENIGKETLVFIEVQTGESFDENDIIRLEDDYGRV